MVPTMVASSPMLRWQKPPILAAWYISAVFSSKRRIRSISRYSLSRAALSVTASFALLSAARCSTFMNAPGLGRTEIVAKSRSIVPIDDFYGSASRVAEWAGATTLAGAIFVFLSNRPCLWVSAGPLSGLVTGLALLADRYGAANRRV